MDWKKKRVLVTGAGGFIASHLVERLVAEGAQVRAFVRYNARGDVGLLRFIPPEVFSQLEVIAGDLRDTEALRTAAYGVDTIFHLGALIAIPYSYVHPREVVETNVMGTLNVLMAARDMGVRRVIHTSTSEVYGTAQYTPIDEKHPLQGQSPYAASKIGADKIVESFYRSFDLPVVTLRPFNTYGPRQSARAVIPTIISQALSGEVIRLGSLTPVRDLNYVSDTVAGFIQVAENPRAIGEVINVGSGKAVSIGDLAEKILAIVGGKKQIVTEDSRVRPEASEVMELLCDHGKAKTLLGWQPQVSLEAGLEQTVRYIKDNLSCYKPEIYNV